MRGLPLKSHELARPIGDLLSELEGMPVDLSDVIHPDTESVEDAVTITSTKEASSR